MFSFISLFLFYVRRFFLSLFLCCCSRTSYLRKLQELCFASLELRCAYSEIGCFVMLFVLCFIIISDYLSFQKSLNNFITQLISLTKVSGIPFCARNIQKTDFLWIIQTPVSDIVLLPRPIKVANCSQK